MADDPQKPQGPFKLNPQRIVLLILGALLLVYILSSLLGGLGNYQQLKEAAKGTAATEDAAQP